MEVTLSGIVIFVSDEQPEKAELPMEVMLSGIVTDVTISLSASKLGVFVDPSDIMIDKSEQS